MTCKDLFLAFCEKAGFEPIKRVSGFGNEMIEISDDCKTNILIIGYGEALFEFDDDGKLIEIQIQTN